ncbi:DUF2515 family protein [Pseudalkalibacillus berkeleyi]|uniref:DUF2515 domain-containing protein n=1 Tax=Pseudalkalibacillus berkeleyi TaxID=1069813 RepID=A0ABS9GXM6_9BACL|nr:DUF2515 family protein [Pseudalkalibacillus berkeleyi]MCF6137537.1 DUF2515 domain-containing protein [Pseudalkalibacillus berkeleyi]
MKRSSFMSEANRRFQTDQLSIESILIEYINRQTKKWNVDNISRTLAYQSFYRHNKEILWPFLASMVSRNAGWNMTDLQIYEFRQILSPEKRYSIFQTYERANWLIFSDAYPQLLLYEVSKQIGEPLFHLLDEFNVSSFMKKEWETYWLDRDQKRIDQALIINEQNVIQLPVIENDELDQKVLSTVPFWLQDRFHFSTVLFPTIQGELYGLSVHGFKKLKNRIALGKRLLKILSEHDLRQAICLFAQRTEPTGARVDYEQYLQRVRRGHRLPLRVMYPIINHHRRPSEDWSIDRPPTKQYFKDVELPKKIKLNDWYEHKRLELYMLSKLTTL